MNHLLHQAISAYRSLRVSQLHRNALAGSGEVVLSAVIAAASYPIYLAYLGYETYGLWLTLAIVMTFSGSGKIGLVPALTKHVAEEYGRNNMEAVQSYTSTALIVLTLTGFIMLAVVQSLSPYFAALMRLSPQDASVIVRFAPWIAVSTMGVMQIEALGGVITGLGRMDMAALLNVTSRFISLVVASLLLILKVGLLSLLLSNALAYLVVYVASFIVIRRITGRACFSASAFSRQRLHRLAGYGVGVLGAYVIDMLVVPFNKFITARYAGVALVPVLELAYALAMRLRSFVASGVRAIMPEISRLDASSDSDAQFRIHRLRGRSVRLAFGLGLIVCGMSALVATPALKLYLASRFNVFLPGSFRIMLIGMILSVGSLPAYYALLALGRVRDVFMSHVVSAVTNLALVGACIFWAPELTVQMVAMCIAASFALSSAYLLFVAKPVGRAAASRPGSVLAAVGEETV